jgi:hypothetical protein
MKKAIVIICVLAVLALLAVPVLAEALGNRWGGRNWPCPTPVPKEGAEDEVLMAGVGKPVLIARGGFR